jgi:biotin transporter BioY
MLSKCTAVDIFRPDERALAVLYDAIMVIGGSFLVGLSAQVKVYLPFGLVPITAQTFAVLVLGALLGSRRAGLTMLFYLVEGALGLPVFAAGVGLPVLFGPTGGYLVGFVPAAYLVGRLAELGWDRKIITAVAAMIAGDAVLLLFGFAWLATLTNIRTAFVTGLWPFIVGDILKVMLAASALPAGWKLLGYLNVGTGRR